MRHRPPITVLSMYEVLHFLTKVCQLDPTLARELVETVIQSQWDAAKMNGVERVHGNGRHMYISADDVIDDYLYERVLSEDRTENLPLNTMREAAHKILYALPRDEEYWEQLADTDVIQCRVHWRRYDVLIGFI